MSVLLVSNFATNTGYAWNMIEDYFIGVAEGMSQKGIKTFVCYRNLSGSYPARFNSLPVEVFAFDYNSKFISDIFRFFRILYFKRIKVLYLVDQPTYAFRYLLFRLAGVKKIIVHDHTSGVRAIPKGVKRMIKKILHFSPFISADYFIGVSKFVVERLLTVNCVPYHKAKCIYNGVNLEKYNPGKDDLLFRELGIDKDKKIVFFSGRANYYKGMHILVEAAEELMIKRKRTDAVFVCCGDGPDLGDFKKMVALKNLQSSFFFLGKRDDINRLLRSATVAVIPSIWHEAFGLTVIESMATGIPVIASRVGGIPEIVEHGVNGYLVEPGSPTELADALEEILQNNEYWQYVTKRARKHVEEHFDIKRSIKELQEVFLKAVY